MIKRKKISLKKLKELLDPVLMENFFKKRYKRYYQGAENCHFLGIKRIKRFIGGKSISASYFLKLKIGDQKKIKIINGRARQRLLTDENNPQRHFLVLKHLHSCGFGEDVPRPLDYIPSYNLLLYENIEGEALQHKLIKNEVDVVLNFIPRIISWFKKLHQLRIKDKRILLRDRKAETRESRHALFLVRKYYSKGLVFLRKTINKIDSLWRKKKNLFLKKENYSLCHYDVHFGNFLIDKQKLKVIDFSDACFYDYFADLACFLTQVESMLEYYVPSKVKIILPKIKKQIINLYLGRQLTSEESFRLKYFEIRRLVLMLANLIFVERDEKSKKKILDNFKKRIDSRLKKIDPVRSSAKPHSLKSHQAKPHLTA